MSDTSDTGSDQSAPPSVLAPAAPTTTSAGQSESGSDDSNTSTDTSSDTSADDSDNTPLSADPAPTTNRNSQPIAGNADLKAQLDQRTEDQSVDTPPFGKFAVSRDDDLTGYSGVSSEYMTYADDRQKPFVAEGDDADPEEQRLRNYKQTSVGRFAGYPQG